ncbi:hypothetical protein FSP39_025288 [Pinctada imbricata]|uniref:Uncharacterized protein n=1 Tax=Pinctada imbricata TaxID=66713 RepID=A0AA88YJF6_PINIB|nr:hypothetical protein FSP39_025288 [Pinctada imbricata]
MVSRLQLWIRNALVLPLIIGDVHDLPMLQDDPSIQDGSISALVLGTTVVAITIVSLLVTNTLTIVPPEKTERAIRVNCMLVFLLGIFSLLLVISHARRKDSSVLEQRKNKLFKVVKVIFLWIFAIGSLYRASLFIIFTIETKEHDFSKGIWLTRLLWDALDLIFVSIQSIFLCVSSYYTFRRRLLLRYGVIFLISSNIMIWFFAVLQESFGKFSGLYLQNKSISRNISKQIFATVDLINKSNVYTLPMLIEYTLLSISWILTLIPSDGPPHDDREMKYPVQSDNYKSIREIDNQLPQTDSRLSKLTVSIYTIVYFICFLMVASEIIIAVKTSIDKTSQFFFQILQCSNLLILIFLNMKIVIFIANRPSFENIKSKKSHLGNQILILSCFGLQAYDVFGAFEGFFLSEVNSLSKCVITKHCISIFATFYQTIVICKLKMYESKSSMYKIKRMILAVSLINFGFWIGDCFIGKHDKNITYTEAEVYGESYWNIVQNILFPIAIFYRFHSGLEMFGIYSSILESPLHKMNNQNEYSRLVP